MKRAETRKVPKVGRAESETEMKKNRNLHLATRSGPDKRIHLES